MTGPYEYVPPEYWLEDTHYGGAFGFNTETSPGEAIPVVESLKKFLPPDHYWPIDFYWRYHAGRGWYMTIDPFTEAMKHRYAGAADMEEYAMKSQVLAYDDHRAMFEAFGRNKYHATGVIQWMMNTAWPSMIWHLYDYYLRPGGAYFGAKKALEMLHVQYSYDDRSVVVVNSHYHAFPGMTVSARILDMALTERYSEQATIDVAPDSSTRVLFLPKIRNLSTTYFVKLELDGPYGENVSRNFYWLSTEPVILAWCLAPFDERGLPVLHDADMTLLNTLPQVTVHAGILPEMEDTEPGWQTTRVAVENQDRSLAFFTQLRLTQGPAGDDVLPVYWEDNYFSLLPGEGREVSARYHIADLKGKRPAVEISGWNVATITVE
jgi:exo-1,4-beta-D-glucosaminidase